MRRLIQAGGRRHILAAMLVLVVSGGDDATEWSSEMTTPITFRKATADADAILRADRAKLDWNKLPFADMPSDIQHIAIKALSAELAAREALAMLQAALDDKVEAPIGKRLLVTFGRNVTRATDSVLFAWSSLSTSTTKTVTFAQFTKTT